MASHGLWIVVMNAARARVLRNVEASKVPGQTDLLLRAAERRLREMLASHHTACPHRRHGSYQRLERRAGAGSERWLSLLEADRAAFIREVARFLDAHRLAGDFGRLAVFAEPGILGGLQAAMPDPLRKMVVLEVAQDIVNLPGLALHSRISEAVKAIQRRVG